MHDESFISFAYGSNMLTARLRERCQSAEPIGVGELRGYALHWHKCGIDRSGKCDIVQTGSPDHRVFGVLFEISNSEKQVLDVAEGLGHGYREIEVSIVCDSRKVTAKAYSATDFDSNLRTSYSWYHAYVLAGARQHGLPAEYIAQIEDIVSDADPDGARHDRNMRLLATVIV
jgi:hypothetical protein